MGQERQLGQAQDERQEALRQASRQRQRQRQRQEEEEVQLGFDQGERQELAQQGQDERQELAQERQELAQQGQDERQELAQEEGQEGWRGRLPQGWQAARCIGQDHVREGWLQLLRGQEHPVQDRAHLQPRQQPQETKGRCCVDYPL